MTWEYSMASLLAEKSRIEELSKAAQMWGGFPYSFCADARRQVR